MDYQELSRAFYKSASTDRFTELDEQARYRRTMPSSFDLGLETPDGVLFIAMPRGTKSIVAHAIDSPHCANGARAWSCV